MIRWAASTFSIMKDDAVTVVYHLGNEVYAWRFRRDQVRDVVRSAATMMRNDELSFSSRDFAYLVQILDKQYDIGKEDHGDTACSD